MKRFLFSIDWWLIVPILFLLIISLTVLQSINPQFFQSQILSLFIGFIAFLFFSQISFADFRYFSLPLYIVCIVLFVIVFAIGIESRGAIRWIDLFGIRLQPSELGKPLLSICFAQFLAARSNKSIQTYFLVILYMLPVILLVYIQPDLGNALLYIGVALLTFILYGIPLILIIGAAIPGIIAIPYFWHILHGYQKQRILTFINPMRDPSGSSYNLIQAVIAVGSGMFLGKGIGEGTQSRLKFLPENHTDFIFASLAEKLGFLGAFIVLVAFVILLYRIYKIYLTTEDTSMKLFTMCVFFFLLLHFFVNIGMNLGLVPVVGVTLPFVSFGGSSLLANLIMLGIVSSISVSGRKRDVLEIR